jgi:hypothetical protein
LLHFAAVGENNAWSFLSWQLAVDLAFSFQAGLRLRRTTPAEWDKVSGFTTKQRLD